MGGHVSSFLLQSLRDRCCVLRIEVGNDDLCASSGKVLDNSSPDALAAPVTRTTLPVKSCIDPADV